MAINPMALLGGVGVVALGVVGGLYATGTASEPKITATTVASENDSTTYNQKYGDYFKHHLVSTKDDNNKAWWEKSFQRLSVEKAKQNTDMSTYFKAATEAHGSKATDLNQICMTAYKLKYSELTGDSKTNYLRDLWKYCSLEEEQPEVLGNADVSSNQTIKEKHKSKLVSAAEGKNKKFWEIQEETFFKKTVGTVEKDGMGSGATSDTTFNSLYTNKESAAHKTLKETCQAAHDQQGNTSPNNLETDSLKFCSIAGSVA